MITQPTRHSVLMTAASALLITLLVLFGSSVGHFHMDSETGYCDTCLFQPTLASANLTALPALLRTATEQAARVNRLNPLLASLRAFAARAPPQLS
jgi:hypothetical protein